jgi:branched-chain amino acid transport system permease protein
MRRLGAPLLVLLGVAALVSTTTQYMSYVIGLAGIGAIVALGVNLLTGFTGQVSLAHGAFYGIGAYTTVLLGLKLGVPFVLALVAGGLLSALVGLAVSVPALRLSGHYLALATLGFNQVVQLVMIHWEGLTNGPIGLRVPGLPPLGWLAPVQTSALAIALVTFVLYCVADNIVRSRTGRALIAIRESEIAAAASGIPLARYKALAFGISAFYAGIGGGLIGSHTLFVSPDYFGFLESVLFIIMIVVGGLGSVVGSVLGAVVMTAIPEVLGSLQEWYGLIYGALLLVFMVAMPRGMVAVGRGLFAVARLVPGRSAS